MLGHSRCGAILATLEELRRPTENQSRNLRSIVDRVRPHVETLLATELRHDEEALLRPDIGTKAQFRKKKPPKTYRSDWSLSPGLDWDGRTLCANSGSACSLKDSATGFRRRVHESRRAFDDLRASA